MQKNNILYIFSHHHHDPHALSLSEFTKSIINMIFFNSPQVTPKGDDVLLQTRFGIFRIIQFITPILIFIIIIM